MKYNRRVLFRKQLEWFSLARKMLQEANLHGFMSRLRDAAYDLFYENDNLRFEFWSIMPVEELAMIRYTMDILYQMNGGDKNEIRGHRGSLSMAQCISSINLIEDHIKKYLSETSNYTVFYSWQSDLNPRYNRNFIEKCLKQAIDNLNKDSSDIKMSIDKNAEGVTGSLDIVNIILQKIDCAVAFVADITPITIMNKKGITNPNVMCELGYALSSLSDERVIVFCNTFYGDLRELPFDLGLKRIITYNLMEETDDEEKKKVLETITKQLAKGLKEIRDL